MLSTLDMSSNPTTLMSSRNPKPMLMQRAHDANGLIVVRGDDAVG